MNNIESSVDRGGRSALHYAALAGDASEVVRLLADGLDANLGDKDGFTPLHFAAQGWHLEVARALLDGGAEVDAQNRHGNTPLGVAVFNSKGRGELIVLLRERGADAEAVNRYGQSPLGLARLIANYDVRQYFADL
jgi:ankyrin repeat protein